MPGVMHTVLTLCPSLKLDCEGEASVITLAALSTRLY